MKQGTLAQKTAEQSIKKGTREKIWVSNMKRLLARVSNFKGIRTCSVMFVCPRNVRIPHSTVERKRERETQ
jgi:hypothetical protein